MAKFEVDFWQSARGVIEVEAENANEAEAFVQRGVEDGGDAYLGRYVQRSEFGVTATEVEAWR